MNYLIKTLHYIKLLNINSVILILPIFLMQLHAHELMAWAKTIDTVKKSMQNQLIELNQNSFKIIEISNEKLEEILNSFSGLGFTFEEFSFELLMMSKKLQKKIRLGDASSVFNKYKVKKGLGLKYPKFNSLEYNGQQQFMLMYFTPNSKNGQYYVEFIEDRDVYYKEKTLIYVDEISNKKIKIRSGIFSVLKVHIDSGISFRPKIGDEQLDTKSILGILPRTEVVLVNEGFSDGKKLKKDSIVTVVNNKYGVIYEIYNYIK